MAIYSLFDSQKDFAEHVGYSLGAIHTMVSGKSPVPKQLIVLLRDKVRIIRLERELQLMATYYNFPPDMNFKNFLKKLGKYEQTLKTVKDRENDDR